MNYIVIAAVVIVTVISIYFSFVGHLKSHKTIQRIHFTRVDHESQETNLFQGFMNDTIDTKPIYSGITWGEFIDLPKNKNKTDRYVFSHSKQYQNLIQCKTTTPTFRKSDWISSSGNSSCLKEMNVDFLKEWRNKSIHDYCESGAMSKIKCYESPNQSKVCVFENAMMNLRRMRRRVHGDGSVQRMWERGFLGTDCGYHAKEYIDGYFSQYKPDIDGQTDAICDYSFQETVVAYSHDNIKHLGHTMNDILNVWSVLWLTENSKQVKDLIFLNIDGFRKGKVYDDNLLQFASHYKSFFKRIIGISDFSSNSKICFKELLFFPKPMLLFIGDRSRHSEIVSNLPSCESNNENIPNPLFQSWNLQFRSILGYISPVKAIASTTFRIVVLRKRSSIIASYTSHGSMYHNLTQLFFDDLSIALKDITMGKLSQIEKTVIEEIDTSSVSLIKQVSVIAKSNVVIGLHGSGINALSMHMPIGTKYCCGVIEIFDHDYSKPIIKGFQNAAQSMGHQYSRIKVMMNGKKEIKKILSIVDNTISKIVDYPSCILPVTLTIS